VEKCSVVILAIVAILAIMVIGSFAVSTASGSYEILRVFTRFVVMVLVLLVIFDE